jgi:hypothetical protein
MVSVLKGRLAPGYGLEPPTKSTKEALNKSGLVSGHGFSHPANGVKSAGLFSP